MSDSPKKATIVKESWDEPLPNETKTKTQTSAGSTSNAGRATDDAVDDSEDLPDDFAEVQKTISGERRRRQSKHIKGIQDLLSFPFSPNIRPLTISDLESCIGLEDAAFANPAHRCSREKFEYRLGVCPELCLGVFCTVIPGKAKGFEINTLRTAHPVETGRKDGAVSVMMAHIISTRSNEELVTDQAMDYPRDFKTREPNTAGLGHQETGRTICIHSLAVDPKLQGCGMGKLIMKAYLQQVKNSNLADRLSLIAQGYLVNYYKRFGFKHVGPSKASFGGGGWHDMTFELGGSPPKQND
ncbi:Uu.00g019170.m01.CDS01 [Anthostomella pinea]|uniref:Uu.00g019170.m01.CDS01 n=1 Tax=Anthostomella pinea TaxID=933095 RepID=A0AAI8W0F6_9PEZI|nr:Uu.00g019170.m01.CDS01 [Anthostomella pinea]